jgi:hypothetical protein
MDFINLPEYQFGPMDSVVTTIANGFLYVLNNCLRILCFSIVDIQRKEFESAITRVSSKRKEYIVCILIKEIASIKKKQGADTML